MVTHSTFSSDVRQYSSGREVISECICGVSTCDQCKHRRRKNLRKSALPTEKAPRRIRYERLKIMRTVSEDDELVQRAANPRTGIISPFVTDRTTEDINTDYLTVFKSEVKKPSPLSRIARKAVGSGPRSRKHDTTVLRASNEASEIESITKPPAALRHLNHYLPRLEFLHPSHFANIEEPSYRRPANLVSKQEEKRQSRPRFYRKEGYAGVPRPTDNAETRPCGGNLKTAEDVRAQPQPLPVYQRTKCSTAQLSIKSANFETTECLNESMNQEMKDQGPGTDTVTLGDVKFSSSAALRQYDALTSVILRYIPETRWVHERLLEMISHVFTTLHHASPALKVLRSPENAQFGEYARALKSIFLAGLYFLVLLNIIALFARAVRVVFKMIAVVGWPVKVLWSLARWVFGA